MSLPDFAPRFDIDLVRPFWDAVAEGKFKLPACSECGRWQWYPFEAVGCHPNAHLEWRDAPTTGTVFTFTRVHRCFLPGDNGDVAPYVNALIELDGVTGPRIVTLLVNLGDREPEIGMRVQLAPVELSNVTLPTFEPVAA